jgi:glycerophosphoryl diester phosphodiesterase
MAALRFLAWSALAVPGLAAPHHDGHNNGKGKVTPIKEISLGPRPYWLVDNMDDGPLKTKLASCSEKKMKRSDWSISHRGGGTLQFPEHTHGSIMAGVRSSLPP